MQTIQLIDFQASAHCRSDTLSSSEGFPLTTCTLEGGRAYGVCSDIGCGAWALVWALGGRSEAPCGEILINGVHASCKDLAARSCFIGEAIFPRINSRLFPGTIESCLSKALRAGGTDWTQGELIDRFHLTPSRLDRKPIYIYHHELWRASAAVGFASGREIFCFPWIHEGTLRHIDVMKELGILDLLRKSGKIVLIPSSHRVRLSAVCDHIINIPAGSQRK